jgi:hypothetical protein
MSIDQTLGAFMLFISLAMILWRSKQDTTLARNVRQRLKEWRADDEPIINQKCRAWRGKP